MLARYGKCGAYVTMAAKMPCRTTRREARGAFRLCSRVRGLRVISEEQHEPLQRNHWLGEVRP